MKSYIIGVEQTNNKILFQGHNAKMVEHKGAALSFANLPLLFAQNMQANGLQPIIFSESGGEYEIVNL